MAPIYLKTFCHYRKCIKNNDMEMHKDISVKASTNIACSRIKHLFCKLVLRHSKKLKKKLTHIPL